MSIRLVYALIFNLVAAQEPVPVILAAVGRSGSTLTEHILQSQGKMFLIDEPLRHLEFDVIDLHRRNLDSDSYTQEFLDHAFVSMFTCELFANSRAGQAYRRLLLDHHTCHMAAWIPEDYRQACKQGQLPTSFVEQVHETCLNSTYRTVKTIRLRGQLSQLPMSEIDKLKLVHLVRQPLHTAQSRLVLGWHKSNASQATDSERAIIDREL
eukprot:TRINITY_DN11150_c0_g1_i5.p1 TRINITY_DN11150_c0_g1~~TRINITY_DN11150_c0_g1_i5.p1  ORF type:complete len:210 (+),score=38.77 TRINITY_DN11150_c0_g1_i5:229-858(+)